MDYTLIIEDRYYKYIFFNKISEKTLIEFAYFIDSNEYTKANNVLNNYEVYGDSDIDYDNIDYDTIDISKAKQIVKEISYPYKLNNNEMLHGIIYGEIISN